MVHPAFEAEYDIARDGHTLEMSFVTESSASPKSLGLSGDERPLSIALESLIVL